MTYRSIMLYLLNAESRADAELDLDAWTTGCDAGISIDGDTPRHTRPPYPHIAKVCTR